MLVILRENIDNLGQVGDVVKVSSGYARNFLLPRKLVELANEGNVKEIEHHKRILEKKRASEQTKAEELATKLAEFSCTISCKVGKGDKIFGSVGPQEISDELKKAGFEIKKSCIHIKDHIIKTLGVHPVSVRLHPNVTATLKVWVAKEKE